MATTKSIIQNAAANKSVSAAPGQKTMKDYLKSMEGEIAKALPSMITAERFTRIAFSALSATPALNSVTPQSFLGAIMTSAQLGLEPNTPLGEAYVIPYGGKATFQLGYKGLIALAYRSGNISTIQAHIVYENDEFEYFFGIEPQLKHIPAMKDRGNPIYCYAMYKTKDGGFGFDVMSIDDIRSHARKYSKSFNSGPWQSDFESMAKKTVLKRALKYAPLSIEVSRNITSDDSIRSRIGEDMSLVDTEYVEAEGTVDMSTGEILPTEGGEA